VLCTSRWAALSSLCSVSQWPRPTPVCCLNKCWRCEGLKLHSTAKSRIVQRDPDATLCAILRTRSSCTAGASTASRATAACAMARFEEADCAPLFLAKRPRTCNVPRRASHNYSIKHAFPFWGSPCPESLALLPRRVCAVRGPILPNPEANRMTWSAHDAKSPTLRSFEIREPCVASV